MAILSFRNNNLAEEAKVEALFDKATFGNTDISNLAFQEVPVENGDAWFNKNFQEFVNDFNLDTCFILNPASKELSQKLSSHIAKENPSISIRGFHLQNTFHLDAETCPEINTPLSMIEDLNVASL